MNKINASRRAFLNYSSRLSLAGAATPFAVNLATLSAAQAQSDDYKALVCVYMHGGNDHANSVLATDPDSWAAYKSQRSDGTDLSLPAVGQSAGVLPILPATAQSARTFALHPVLDPLKALFDMGSAAVVANVGPLVEPLSRGGYLNGTALAPPKLFSHNDQTSVWQAFAPEGALTGWGGRMGDLMASMNNAQSFTCISPAGNAVWISGRDTVPYQVSVRGPTAIQGIYGGLNWPDPVSEIFEKIVTANYSNVFEQSLSAVTRSAIDAQQRLQAALLDDSILPDVPVVPLTGSRNWLATQLRIVARIIAGRQALGMRRQVFMVTMAGFDTHDNQISRHTPLLQELAQGIEYFKELMSHPQVNAFNEATLMTASEFGRTLAINGDGTDHGWGSHHFVVGGAVNGGDIYGRFPDYERDGPDDVGGGRLLPNFSVDQYGGTLANWFGVDDSMLNDVFPNLVNFGSNRNLGFMRS
ncbi:MAG: DUF1501 domain-containing protein [Granulosicoccus sp.]